jgi:hypothetical protein
MNNSETEILNDNNQQIQQSPNSKKTSKKRKLDDLGLENISDSECPSKWCCSWMFLSICFRVLMPHFTLFR